MILRFCKFGFLLIVFSSSISGTVTSELKKTLVQTCRAAELVATFVGTHMLLSLLHEGTHVLTAQIALSSGAKANNTTPELEPFNFALAPTATYAEFENKWINILITVAGTAMGLAGSYGALKANNIVHEYLKDYNFKRALKDGMKKDLLNHHQNHMLQAAVLVHLGYEGLILYPFKIKELEIYPLGKIENFESHGYYTLKDLNIIKQNRK